MMSVELHNTKLLLPSQENEKMAENNKPMIKDNNTFCFLSSSDLGSGFSSPIWSEFGSTESSEEDEHYYTSDLVLQMAHSMLLDDEENEKPLGSPQSTLTSSLKPSTPPLKKINPNPNVGIRFQSKQALIDEQIRAIQITFKGQQPRNHEEAKNHQNNKRPHRSRWTTNNPEQRNPSGMRPVYLNGSGSGTGCSSGTGVFLPRGNGIRCESRRKTGCAPVIIPAKVVQALNLHFNKPTASFTLKNNASNTRSSSSLQEPHHHQDIGLPQEWTY